MSASVTKLYEDKGTEARRPRNQGPAALCRERIKSDRQGSAMLFFSRHANWDNRDYRDYCDHRARVKRRLRLRLRMSIGLTLMVGMLLATAWSRLVGL